MVDGPRNIRGVGGTSIRVWDARDYWPRDHRSRGCCVIAVEGEYGHAHGYLTRTGARKLRDALNERLEEEESDGD